MSEFDPALLNISPRSYVGRCSAMALTIPTSDRLDIRDGGRDSRFPARKSGSRHSTAWGISVFFALALALPSTSSTPDDKAVRPPLLNNRRLTTGPGSGSRLEERRRSAAWGEERGTASLFAAKRTRWTLLRLPLSFGRCTPVMDVRRDGRKASHSSYAASGFRLRLDRVPARPGGRFAGPPGWTSGRAADSSAVLDPRGGAA